MNMVHAVDSMPWGTVVAHDMNYMPQMKGISKVNSYKATI